MTLLVIGGTRFVGRKIVESAIGRGHEVTLFNRGKTNPGGFPELETIVGDRTGNLDGLQGRQWDAVIDVCGYWPRAVEPVCSVLNGSVGRYVFISSISVYSDSSPIGLGEDTGQLLDNAEADVEELKMEMYGGLKVLCERVVEAHFGERALIVRPGLVVGPDDHSDRFTYWPRKFMRPGAFLAPNCKEAPVQVIDGRDLGDFAVQATERSLTGAYHVAGPTPPISFGEFIRLGVEIGGGVAVPHWVPCDLLAEKGVEPWSDLPLVTSLTKDPSPLSTVDNSKAVAAGLQLRTVATTISDTIDWWKAERIGTDPRWGLSDEKEHSILDSLKEKASQP